LYKFHHWINKFHHISFNQTTRFIDQIIKINLCMMQDLFHLCIIEPTYFPKQIKKFYGIGIWYHSRLVTKVAEHHINFDI
jgi:hypothetical protein